MQHEAELNESLRDLAGGDEARAELLRASLGRLASGAAGELLQEMARDVLAGRIALRQALTSDAYGSDFVDGFTRFWERYEKLAPSRQQKLIRAGEAYLDTLRETAHRSSSH